MACLFIPARFSTKAVQSRYHTEAVPATDRLTNRLVGGHYVLQFWDANTKSGYPGRDSVRCEPDWRFILQPIDIRAASSFLALTEGHWLMRQKMLC
jgi:hypothetical protein